MKRREPPKRPGEYDWQSAADFRLGQRAQAAGDLQRARMFYARVIGQSHDHVAARHNAAVVEIRARRPDIALAHLEILEHRLDKRDQPPGTAPMPGSAREAIICSLHYNMALAFATPSRDRDVSFDHAVTRTRMLVETVLGRLIVLDGLSGHKLAAARAERDVLSRLEPAAAVFHASMLIESGRGDVTFALENALGDPREPSEQAHSPEQRRQLLTALEDERRWPPIAKRFAAGSDPRARYNVACYLGRLSLRARSGKELDLLTRAARLHLRHALQDPELVAWASRDPALRAVEAADEEAWAAMLAEIADGMPAKSAAAASEAPAPAPGAPPTEPPSSRVELRLTADGRYSWRLAADTVLATSAQDFGSGMDALSAAQQVMLHAIDARVQSGRSWEDDGWRFQVNPVIGSRGRYQWTLVDPGDVVVARAPQYLDSLGAAKVAAELVRDAAPNVELPFNADDADAGSAGRTLEE